MQITISGESEEFIKAKIAEDRFSSPSDAFEEWLLQVRVQDTARKERIRQLNAEIEKYERYKKGKV